MRRQCLSGDGQFSDLRHMPEKGNKRPSARKYRYPVRSGLYNRWREERSACYIYIGNLSSARCGRRCFFPRSGLLSADQSSLHRAQLSQGHISTGRRLSCKSVLCRPLCNALGTHDAKLKLTNWEIHLSHNDPSKPPWQWLMSIMIYQS